MRHQCHTSRGEENEEQETSSLLPDKFAAILLLLKLRCLFFGSTIKVQFSKAKVNQ